MNDRFIVIDANDNKSIFHSFKCVTEAPVIKVVIYASMYETKGLNT